MDNGHATQVLVSLFVVFVAAQIGTEIAQRLKMPTVVGETAGGCAPARCSRSRP
jgi:Kef-type K+ transport system membrane component KefB